MSQQFLTTPQPLPPSSTSRQARRTPSAVRIVEDHYSESCAGSPRVVDDEDDVSHNDEDNHFPSFTPWPHHVVDVLTHPDLVPAWWSKALKMLYPPTPTTPQLTTHHKDIITILNRLIMEFWFLPTGPITSPHIWSRRPEADEVSMELNVLLSSLLHMCKQRQVQSAVDVSPQIDDCELHDMPCDDDSEETVMYQQAHLDQVLSQCLNALRFPDVFFSSSLQNADGHITCDI